MSFDLQIQNNDLVLKNGDFKTVSGTNKLSQDVLKMCLTTAGSNPFNPWYGSFISRTIIGNPNDTPILVQISKSQLYTSLENLKKLQDLQIKSFQRVSSDELIAAISNIAIVRDQSDQRIFNVYISILTKGNNQLSTGFNVNSM